MKATLLIGLLAPAVMGHCKLPASVSSRTKNSADVPFTDMFERTIVGGVKSGVWEYIRETANNPHNGPIEDVTSNLMRCYEKPGRRAAAVQTVAAGTRFGFTSNAPMGHPGPSLFYMARVPDGQDVNSWVPSGNVWFKIDQHGNTPGVHPQFEVEMLEIYTTIPANLQPGNYLLRAEHIGLHSYLAPQFYISCAQLRITGSGTASPAPLVSFPGAYSANDPGLIFNIYTGTSSAYPYPGPAVWSGGGGSSPPPTTPPSPPPATTTAPPSPPTTTTTRTTAQPQPTGGSCAPLWGQCGGQGWTGPTCCASGTCSRSNDWYHQCTN